MDLLCFCSVLCLLCLCASVYMCFVVTCWERADLLALVCGVYYEFVTFPLVSWVRCGTWLYRFLIFAPLLTLNRTNAFISFSSILFHLFQIITCILLALLENSFNIYTKCPFNGTLSNTNTHMRDATECINSIGYALFAAIKSIFSDQTDLEIDPPSVVS